MNFSLKPRQLLFAFIPGFFLLIGIFIIHLKFEFQSISTQIEKINLAIAIAIIVMSYISGVIIDSIRDGFLENLFDFIFNKFTENKKLKWNIKPINWKYFYLASETDIDKFDDNYYIWYVVNLNLIISNLLLLIFIIIEVLLNDYCSGFLHPHLLQFTILFLFLSGLILFINAWGLRKEISEITNTVTNAAFESLPHENVYTRLHLSEIHGIGVFAIKFIPKGTYVFKGDSSEMTWVPTKQIESLKLPFDLQKLYEDFCVKKNTKNVLMFGCPDNFNNMPISWYLNTSKTPNMACDANYNFYSINDIQPGEELTADYETYSE